MKKTLIALFFFLACACVGKAQGAFYRIGPFQQSGLAYVCPVPDGGTPCPSPVAIFSNSTLTTSLANPITMPQGATVSFWVASGQYILQFPASGFNQVVTIGAGGVSANSIIPPAQVGPGFNIRNYGAFGDTQVANAVNISRVANTLTLPAGMTATVGQLIQCGSSAFTTQVVPYPPTNGGNKLPVAITNVAGQVVTYNATPVGGGGNLVDGFCYFGHDDTTAVKNAFAAALVAGNGSTIFSQNVLTYSSRVMVPCGGYMISSTPFDASTQNQNLQGVSIIGDGPNCSIFYPVLGFTNTSPANCGWFLCGFGWGQIYRDFGIELLMSGYPTLSFANEDLVKLSCGKCLVENLHIENWYNGGSAQYMMNDAGGAEIHYPRFENPLGGATGAAAFICSACSTDIYDPFFSNTTQNLAVSNVTGRGSGQYLNVHGGIIDEGAIPTIAASKAVAFFGTTLMGGANCLSVDATSEVRMSGGYCGSFLGNAGGGGPTVASGGQLWLTEVEVSANGAGQYCYNSVAANGILDLGGNKCILAGGATTLKAGGFGLSFPLTTDSTTQLGGRQILSGTVPTCSVTGAGSTATCTVDTGSADAGGKITITANGAGIAALGTFTLTFSTTPNGAYGTNGTTCTGNFMNGTGTWNARAGSPIFTTLGTTTQVANWDNNAVVLTSGSTYKVTYGCYGQ